MQRMAGGLTMNTPTPVTPFRPPPGNFPIASIQLEIDLLGKGDGKEVTLDAPEVVKHFQRVFHNNVFKMGQAFATEFSEKRISLKATVKGFDYVDMGAGSGAWAAAIAVLLQCAHGERVSVRRAAESCHKQLLAFHLSTRVHALTCAALQHFLYLS